MVLAYRQCISMLKTEWYYCKMATIIDYAFPMLEVSQYNDDTVELRYSSRAVTYL